MHAINLSRGASLVLLAAFGGAYAFCTPAAPAEEAAPKVIYLSDMSRCTPKSALAKEVQQGRWQLIPYETVDPQPGPGTMIGAASFVNAPEVRLPLGVSGWHAIYVGYWNPHYAYDGGTTVKVKLTGDPCFTRFSEGEPSIDYNATHISEVFFKAADLTGQDLEFGKVGGSFAQKAYLAYVKLVPLSPEEVKALQADRARTDTRVVVATIDGISYFWNQEYTKREHLLELVEPYRYSDVGKVLWAVCYGEITNYPSKSGIFWATQKLVPISSVPGNNAYIAGEKTAYDSLRKLVGDGIIPEAVVAEQMHKMGLKFEAMFRLAILGSIPPERWVGAKTFLATHPEFRQVMADGTPVEKASYAFPEVRNQMLAIIRETAETFDLDGANLGFVRGPHFMQYEKPVLDDFRQKSGAEGRGVSFNDPRMREVRCHYLNEFVHEARRTLDRVGRKKGKKLELSVWVFPTLPWNLDCGMDVKHWLERGWLDSVIIHGYPPDAEMIATIKANHCRAIYFPHMPPGSTLLKEAAKARELGAQGLAMWDLDTAQDQPGPWGQISRLGHGDQPAPAHATLAESHRLKTVGGYDVLQGLGAAVYSGG